MMTGERPWPVSRAIATSVNSIRPTIPSGLSLNTEFELIRRLSRKIDVGAERRLGSIRMRSARRSLHGDVTFCLTSVHLPPGIAGVDELIEIGKRDRVTVIGLLAGFFWTPIAGPIRASRRRRSESRRAK